MGRLVGQYNNLCDQISSIIDIGRAPPNSVTPPLLDTKDLYKMDVDNPIWTETGLSGDDDRPAPNWLVDDAVSGGIRLMLEVDRCVECKARLIIETDAMEYWFLEEYTVLEKVLSESAYG